LTIRLLSFSTTYTINRTATATSSTATATTTAATVFIIIHGTATATANAIVIVIAIAVIVIIVESKGACAVKRQASYRQYWLWDFSKDIHDYLTTICLLELINLRAYMQTDLFYLHALVRPYLFNDTDSINTISIDLYYTYTVHHTGMITIFISELGIPLFAMQHNILVLLSCIYNA
jgi:hypothetical protein